MNTATAIQTVTAAMSAHGRDITKVGADGQWMLGCAMGAPTLKKVAKGLGIPYTGKNPTTDAVFAAVRAALAA